MSDRRNKFRRIYLFQESYPTKQSFIGKLIKYSFIETLDTFHLFEGQGFYMIGIPVQFIISFGLGFTILVWLEY